MDCTGVHDEMSNKFDELAKKFDDDNAPAFVNGVLNNISKKLGEKATEVFTKLSAYFPCEYDEAGSIGKRYRRQDEIGTPFCITYDFDSETDGCVTVRDRDTMEQERMKIEDVIPYIQSKLVF